MKLFGALAIFLAMAMLVIGAGGSGAGATYVDHAALAAMMAKGGAANVPDADIKAVVDMMMAKAK